MWMTGQRVGFRLLLVIFSIPNGAIPRVESTQILLYSIDVQRIIYHDFEASSEKFAKYRLLQESAAPVYLIVYLILLMKQEVQRMYRTQ